MIAEPITGAREAPKALKPWRVPIAAARRFGGNRSLTSAPPTTRPAATPAACIPRAARNTPMLGAAAATRLAAPNSTSPPVSTTLPEKRSTIGPYSNWLAASTIEKTDTVAPARVLLVPNDSRSATRLGV
jgi:hypothetical protein